MPDFDTPITITLANDIKCDLKYTIGSMRRLKQNDNLDVLVLFTDKELIQNLVSGRTLDRLVIEGVKRKGKLPEGLTEEAIIEAIEEMPLYSVTAIISAVRDAITKALIDPEAPKNANPPTAPSTGANSLQLVE